MKSATAEPPDSVRRIGIVMEPETSNPCEVEGVLNPAAIRGSDGELYLFPRMVAAGNFSRIGRARVVFDQAGDPIGVERMGIALEPRAAYELNSRSGGGVEDPRITFIQQRQLYVMTYTAYGPHGPRIAWATSVDLTGWRRLGLVRFAPFFGVDLRQNNKDALLFPELVSSPDGRPSLALIHRPASRGSSGVDAAGLPAELRAPPSIWISYAPLDEILSRKCIEFGQHHVLIQPRGAWEQLKVGGGTPPLSTPDGWLVFYHGVEGRLVDGCDQQQHVRYSAGMLLLDTEDPRKILKRSRHSILTPSIPAEVQGIVPRVVFPTGVDKRLDGALDLYYGMADYRIGVARVNLYQLISPESSRAA